jgi:hypothetical protein
MTGYGEQIEKIFRADEASGRKAQTIGESSPRKNG